MSTGHGDYYLNTHVPIFYFINPLVLWCCGTLGFVVHEDYKALSRLVRDIGVVHVLVPINSLL